MTDGSGYQCVPYSMAYLFGLFFDKDKDPRKNPYYYRWDIEKQYKDDFGKKWCVKGQGTHPFITCRVLPLHFKIEENVSRKHEATPTRGVLIQESDLTTAQKEFNYKAIINAGYVIMTVIERKPINHSIVIVGYKYNGDVIYMDPEKRNLQQVHPSKILYKEYKMVIIGIN